MSFQRTLLRAAVVFAMTVFALPLFSQTYTAGFPGIPSFDAVKILNYNNGTLILDGTGAFTYPPGASDPHDHIPFNWSGNFENLTNLGNAGTLILQNNANLYMSYLDNTGGRLIVNSGSMAMLNSFGSTSYVGGPNIIPSGRAGTVGVTAWTGPKDALLLDLHGSPDQQYFQDWGVLAGGNYVLAGDLWSEMFPALSASPSTGEQYTAVLIGAIAPGTSLTLNGGKVYQELYLQGVSQGYTTLGASLSYNGGTLTVGAGSYVFTGGDLSGNFTNDGTISTQGTGYAHFSQPFQNNGTDPSKGISVGQGSTLQIDHLNNLAPNGMLIGGNYAISGNLIYGDYASVSGVGTPIYAVAANASITLSGASAYFGNYNSAGFPSSNLAFGHDLALNDGAIQVKGGATLNLASGTGFTNSGTIQVTGGGVVDSTSTVFQNNGTILVTGHADSSHPSTLRASTFINDGSLTVDGLGFPHAAFTANSFTNNASGTVTLANWAVFAVNQFQNSGTLALNGGEARLGQWSNLDVTGKLTGGTYVISGGGTLYYSNTASIAELGGGTHLTLDGGGFISHTPPNDDNALYSLKTIDAGASLTLLNGAQLKTDPGFQNAGSLTVDGGSRLTVDNGALFNNGVVTVSNGASLLVAGLDNTGTLNVNGGMADFSGGVFMNLDQYGTLSGGGTFTISNGGEMIYSGGPITSVAAGTTLNVESGGDILAEDLAGHTTEGWALTSNYGNVEYDTNWNLPGNFFNYGDLTIGDGGQLVLQDGSNFQNISGGTLFQTGGLIEGGGEITGDLNQSGGTLKPGYSPGTLSIQGDYILLSGGTLQIDFADPFGGPGIGWGFLHVTGDATLDGAINLLFLNSGAIAPGRYELMDYRRLLSSGGGLIDPGLPDWVFTLDFGTNALYLDIDSTATPEPGSWALVFGGLLLAGAVRRARRRRNVRQEPDMTFTRNRPIRPLRAALPALLLVSCVLVWSGCARRFVDQPAPPAGGGYSAVLLANGSVYFGKLEGLGTAYPVLRDVYYVQSATDPETKKVTSILVKRGKEWHAPDRMIINDKSIVFVEPVGADSKVAQLIAESKK